MKRWIALLLLASATSTACASSPTPTPCSARTSAEPSARPVAEIALGHASGQFHTLPVRVNDHVVTVAILDTGIGLALISQGLCERIHCAIDGEFVGRRMSGQEIRVPLTRVDRLTVGGVVQEDVVAGVIDIDGFFPEPQIEVFVGLPFFRDRPFTIDGPRRTLTLESEASLAVREERGRVLPIRLQPHGPALDTFVQMTLADGAATAEVLMDTGSRALILHPRYAELLGIDLAGEGTRRHDGHDETGQAYARFYVELDAPVAFAGAPEMRRTGASTMFQEIIYDGLVGTELLSSFVVTWDLPRSRLLVARD